MKNEGFHEQNSCRCRRLSPRGRLRDGERGPPTFQYAVDSSAKPWTHEAFDDDADKLTFAVISDLTGGEREKIFDIAVAGLNLLRPEAIMSVGDLIDGVGENEASLTAEWEVFDGRTTKLTAPVLSRRRQSRSDRNCSARSLE